MRSGREGGGARRVGGGACMQMSTRRRSFSGKGAGRRQLVLKRGRKEVGRRRERAAVSTWVPSSLAGCSDGDSSSPPLPPPTAGSPSPLGSGGPRATCSGPPPPDATPCPWCRPFCPCVPAPPQACWVPVTVFSLQPCGAQGRVGGSAGAPLARPLPLPPPEPKAPNAPQGGAPAAPRKSRHQRPHCTPLRPTAPAAGIRAMGMGQGRDR